MHHFENNHLIAGQNFQIWRELVRAGVRFLVIGGCAIQYYASGRKTLDLDLLIEPSIKTQKAFSEIFPLLGFSRDPKMFDKFLVPGPARRQFPSSRFYTEIDLLLSEEGFDWEVEWQEASQIIIRGETLRIGTKAFLIKEAEKALQFPETKHDKYMKDIQYLS